eukprot:scaffold323_cov74-Skeletonema_dohrnii-CCMP3373.AAC.1
MPGERTVVRLSPSLVAVDDSVMLMLLMMRYSMKTADDVLFIYWQSIGHFCSWLFGPRTL